MTNANDKRWFVLYTKPRHEFKAASQIEAARVELYLPVITRLKQWSDRKKKVTEPAFRGYIFIHGNEKERLAALEQPAVVSAVFYNGKPATIPDKQLEDLRTLMESKKEVTITEEFPAGQRVKITSGPFEGVEGIVYQTTNNENHLGISIELLRRTVSVELPVSSVTKEIKGA